MSIWQSDSSGAFTSDNSGIFEPQSVPLGSVVWGHHTAVDEDNDENFAGNWTSGESGSGDTELLYVSGSTELSSPWYLGAGWVQITLNKYRSGGSVTVSYKTGNSEANCIADSWHLFDTTFKSKGYVLIKLEE